MENFVGCRQIEIKDHVKGISFPVLIQYPTLVPSEPTAFGPYVMDVSVNAEPLEDTFPLVMISHGNGGSHLLYRTISTYLAQNGFVVGMVEHYGNNRNNNSLEYTRENLVNRPAHISLAIDVMLTEDPIGKHINKEKIAIIGHSMGGYTALALAGGVAWEKEGEKVATEPDARIVALVLLAPGAGWFKNSLDKVTVPILLYMAEHDPVTPLWNAEIILEGVTDPTRVTYRLVKNAGHFSFLSPFPEFMKKPEFRPSTDPEGFDREVFHRLLPVEILQFLQKSLV